MGERVEEENHRGRQYLDFLINAINSNGPRTQFIHYEKNNKKATRRELENYGYKPIFE